MPLDFDTIQDPAAPISVDDLHTAIDVELLVVRAPKIVGDRLEHLWTLKESTVAANDAANAVYQKGRNALIELRSKREERLQKGFKEADDDILQQLNEKIAAGSKRLKTNVPKPRFSPDFKENAKFFARQQIFNVAEFEPASGKTPELRLIAARENNLPAAKKDLAAAETLPRDLDAVLTAARAQLKKLRDDGKLNFRRLWNPSDHTDSGEFRAGKPAGKIEYPELGRAMVSEHRDIIIPDSIAVIAWLMGDSFDEKILAAIEAAAPKNGVPVAEKIRRVNLAQEQFVLAIRQEDAALIELEKQGVFKRERGYHPAIHLGLSYPAEKIIAAL